MRHRFVTFVLFVLFALPATLGAQDAPPPMKPDGVKNPTTARIVGIIPGAGHIYAGEPGRGLLYAGALLGVTVVSAMALAVDCLNDWTTTDCDDSSSENVATAVILGLWGWTIYDAGRAAHRTNARRVLRATLHVAPVRHCLATGEKRRAINLGLALAVP